jgi:hypothetical protein
VPVRPLSREHWLRAPRLPLGDAYRGLCHAGPEPFEPPIDSQEDVCNCGYARGRCDRFPAEGADAIRFSVIADDEARIRIVYVFERAHAPDGHGVIEYLKSAAKVETDVDVRLLAQARAFIGSYLRCDAPRTFEQPGR